VAEDTSRSQQGRTVAWHGPGSTHPNCIQGVLPSHANFISPVVWTSQRRLGYSWNYGHLYTLYGVLALADSIDGNSPFLLPLHLTALFLSFLFRAPGVEAPVQSRHRYRAPSGRLPTLACGSLSSCFTEVLSSRLLTWPW
jgi:hypothetical protein